jgi:hypothetical protein
MMEGPTHSERLMPRDAGHRHLTKFLTGRIRKNEQPQNFDLMRSGICLIRARLCTQDNVCRLAISAEKNQFIPGQIAIFHDMPPIYSYPVLSLSISEGAMDW